MITYAIMADGTEATGLGDDFKVGERVEVFFHERYNRVKFRRTVKRGAATPKAKLLTERSEE